MLPKSTRRTIVLATALGTCALATPANAADRKRLRATLRRIHREATSHAERVDRIARLFLGKPYKLSPLGEGPSGDRDTDPIVDFERFDCVTYAEEVMALASSPDLDEAIADLQRIRYADGIIDYGRRNHITMAQWIPINIAAHHVSDVTRSVGSKDTITATLELTDAHFSSPEGKRLRLEKDERPLGRHELPIIIASKIAQRASALPHASLITTVRAARDRVPYRASHVGLVFRNGDSIVVRHAHQPSGKVIEDSFAQFAKRARTNSKWPVTGFNVLRINA